MATVLNHQGDCSLCDSQIRIEESSFELLDVPMSYEPARFTLLKSGLAIVTHYAKEAKTTDIAIKTRAGSRDEVFINVPRGTAHFDEHAVCTGSAHYPDRARKYIESVKGFDDNLNSFTPATQFSFTNYYASVPAASTHYVVDVMCDAISRPNYRERDIENLREQILHENINNQLSFNLFNLENWILPQVAYDGNSLLYPVIGDTKSIEETSASHMREFHALNVTANRTVIVVEGNDVHDDIVQTVEKRISLPSGLRPYSPPPVYTGGDERHRMAGEGARVVLAFKAPREGDSDSGIAFKMACELLCAKTGKHSIRKALDRCNVYNFSIYPSQKVDSGLFVIAFNALDTRRCLDAIHKTMFDMAQNIDIEAWAGVREKLEKHIKSTETLFKIGAADMAENVCLYGRLIPPDHYSRLKLEVTDDRIKNAACDMLSHPPTFVAAGDTSALPSPDEVRNLFHVEQTSYHPYLSRVQVPQSQPLFC